MKKVILSLFAVAALASCVQTEELGVANNKEAIGFDTFVDNTTKGDLYTTANLEAFKVYGTISQNGAVVTNIFDDVTVTKNGSAWTYDSQYTQYWIPGFRYDFAAVVDGDVVKNSHNMPESIEVDMTEQKDVLYATAGRDFGANDVATKVGFTFNHLLAKAKFTVKNTIVNGKDFVYNIESIKIKNADKNGAYDVATGVWAANDTYCADFGVVATLAMGSQPVSGADVLLLPSNNKDLDIEVEYKLTYKGATLKSETKTLNAVLTLEQGKAYNFIVEFGKPGEEIEFKAEVNDWANGSVEVLQGISVPVTSAQELADAIANPEVGEAVLMNDIDLTAPITRSEDATPTIVKSFVIDGNGKKLNYSGSNRVIDITYNNGENSNLVVTIKNLTINITSSYCQRGINYNAGGLLIIDNVKFEGTAPTYAVNCPASSDNAVIKIKNSELTGNIALNLWGENMKVDVVKSILTSVDDEESENYNAISLNNDGITIAEGTIVNIEGGKVIARDEKGEPSYAVRNSTATGYVHISETTEVVGTVANPVAIVYYNGYNEFYSCATLQGAIDKAIETNASGVRVITDIVLEEPLTIAKGQNVVLDLNGHTVSAIDNSTASYALITNNGNLTINDTKGGALKLTATNNRGWNAYSSVISNATNGVLVVNGGTIEHLGGTDMAYGIDILTNSGIGDATCTINGGHIKSTYRAIRQFLNCDKKMNTLVVNGGVIEGANKSIWMQDPSKKSNLGTLTVAAEAQLKGDVYLFVTAGSTEWPVEVSIASAALVGESTVVTGNVPEQYEVVEENGVWTVKDNTRYATDTESLQTLLAEGGDIVLANDITLSATAVLPQGKVATLDLNGCALTIENAETTYALCNLGTLTLKDSSNGNGSVTARGIYNGYDNGTPVPTAKLTVESGTFNAVGPNGGAAVYNYGELEVKGGKFTAVGSYALNTQSGGKMTVYGGETVKGGIYVSGAELVVKGGQVNNARSGCHTIYSWNSTVTINGGTIHNDNSGNATLFLAGSSVGTINGGTFSIKDGRVPGNGNTWTSCLLDTAGTATLTINNGLCNGGFRVQAGTTCTINGGSFNDCYGSNYNIYGTVTVKGGTYTDATAQNFAKKYVAEGYQATDNGNGTWTVQ